MLIVVRKFKPNCRVTYPFCHPKIEKDTQLKSFTIAATLHAFSENVQCNSLSKLLFQTQFAPIFLINIRVNFQISISVLNN